LQYSATSYIRQHVLGTRGQQLPLDTIEGVWLHLAAILAACPLPRR